MSKFCRHCGTELEDQARFCDECGKSVEVIEPMETVVEVPVQTPIQEPVQTPTQTSIQTPIPTYEKTSKKTTKKPKKSRKKMRFALITTVIVVFIAAVVAGVFLLPDYVDFGKVEELTDKYVNNDNAKNDEEVEKDDKDIEEVIDPNEISEEMATTTLEDGDTFTDDEHMTVRFLEGSLATKTEVTLNKVFEKEDVEGALTDLFDLQVDDIPKGTIEVSMKLPDNYEKAYAVIGVERQTYVVSGGFEGKGFEYIVTENISDGFAVFNIDPDNFVEEKVDTSHIKGNVVYAADKKKYHARMGLFDCEYYYDDGHFRVVYESWVSMISVESSKALLADLEATYEYYKGLGYHYDRRDSWPLDVYIKKMDDEGGFEVTWYYYFKDMDPDGGCINLNISHFKKGYTSGQLLPLIYHEFFHFVQHNYGYHDDTTWFDEASAVYFENVAAGGGTSPITSQYAEKAFESMLPVNDSASDGYAREPFVKFLVNTYGQDIVKAIYVSLEAGNNLNKAITDSTASSRMALVNPYYLAYAKGEVGQYPSYTHYQNISDGKTAEDRALGEKLILDYPDTAELALEAMTAPVEVGKITLSLNGEAPKFIPLEIPESVINMINDNTSMALEASNGVKVNFIKIDKRDVTSMTGLGGVNGINGFADELLDEYLYMVVLVNEKQEAVESELIVKLQSAPTLDEVAGDWPGSTLVFEELYIDPDLLEMYAGIAEEMLGGCETSDGVAVTLDTIESIVGQSFSVLMTITKTSDNGGTIVYSQPGVEEGVDLEDPLPFTYDEGKLSINYSEEGAQITINMNAFYVDKDTVGIDGSITLDYEGGMIRAVVTLKGEKDLVKE